MNSQKMWMLLVSFPLVCAMIGCGEKPESVVAKPKAVVDEPTASVVGESEPILEQTKPALEEPTGAVGEPEVAEEPRAAMEEAIGAQKEEREPSRRLGLPVEMTNTIGMKLQLILPGEFMMGSLESEEDRDDDEYQHRVRITKRFYLGAYEVTQAQYEQVMGTNPSYFLPEDGGADEVSGMDTSRFPVELVSWEDAVGFCRKLSALPGERSAGRVYRLPTEAEWEYACRAGTATPFHFGTALNGREANCIGDYPYGTESKGPDLGRPTTVGSYRSNGFGLYDMHGNVWEWCQDWYGEDYYRESPVEDPTGPTTGSHRVVRGGGWGNGAGFCRSAMRRWGTAGVRSNYDGFRVALVPVDASGE